VQQLVRLALVTVCAAVCTFLVVVIRYRSAELAVGYLAGKELAIAPSTWRLRADTSGARQLGDVTIANFSQHAVRIVGAQSSCNCLLAPDAIPVAIPPGERITLTVTVLLSRGSAGFNQRIVFFTDNKETPRIVWHAVGEPQ
jgi:hypothetical protein